MEEIVNYIKEKVTEVKRDLIISNLLTAEVEFEYLSVFNTRYNKLCNSFLYILSLWYLFIYYFSRKVESAKIELQKEFDPSQ